MDRASPSPQLRSLGPEQLHCHGPRARYGLVWWGGISETTQLQCSGHSVTLGLVWYVVGHLEHHTTNSNITGSNHILDIECFSFYFPTFIILVQTQAPSWTELGTFSE